MAGFRNLLDFPRLAAILLLLAFGARLTTPTGFMPINDGTRFVLTVCPGATPSIVRHGQHHAPASPGHADQQPCAFTALVDHATSATTEMVTTPTLPHFVALVPTMRAAPHPRAPARLLPPLRAPPR